MVFLQMFQPPILFNYVLFIQTFNGKTKTNFVLYFLMVRILHLTESSLKLHNFPLSYLRKKKQFHAWSLFCVWQRQITYIYSYCLINLERYLILCKSVFLNGQYDITFLDLLFQESAFCFLTLTDYHDTFVEMYAIRSRHNQ